MVCIPDDLVPYLKIGLSGTIFAAIAYGIVLVLSGNCIHLLRKKRGTYSNRTRIFLLIYITVMLLLSTLSLIQSSLQSTSIIFQLKVKPVYFFHPSAIIVTTWGADGFLIWRCFTLYQGASKGPRVAVVGLLSLLSLASLGFGIMLIIQITMTSPIQFRTAVFTLFSTLVNIILAALIVFRLVYHRIRVRKVLGEDHGSLYSNIMAMCIESSALIVVFSGLLAVLTFANMTGGQFFVYLVLPQICVISPLLIVYRVAMGRAMASTVRPSEQVTAQIRFHVSPSNHPHSEGEV